MSDSNLDPIILDASCVLNLFASGKFKEIAESLPEPLVVSDYVLDQEALFVVYRDKDEERRREVDLNPLIGAGLIQVISIDTDEERETFVDLATELDDGEAITIALGESRGCCVATDDRKALKVISRRVQARVTSTLALVKRWGDSEKVSKVELKTVLSAILEGASYFPGEIACTFQD